MAKSVAVDLDGTIAKFDEWKGSGHIGLPKKGAKENLRYLKEKLGFTIIVHTCRSDLEVVEDYLKDYEIPYDHINENPNVPETVGDKKVYADYYIDDRAIEFSGKWKHVLYEIMERERNNE
jgi:hypothetical protein